MTFGISRDDSAGFLPEYVENEGILPQEPFQVLDQSTASGSSSSGRVSAVAALSPV